MMKIELPPFVENVVDDLKTNASIKSIWLIGSRANNSAREDSDWDLLVFVEEELSSVNRRDSSVDVIRVDTNGKYLTDGESADHINLFNWSWNDSGNGEATYKKRVCPQVSGDGLIDLSSVYMKTLRGYQIWSIHV